MKKEVIIFDFDSTLVDSLGYWIKTIEKLTFKKYNMKVDNRTKGITHGGNNAEKAKKVVELLGVEDDYRNLLKFWSERMIEFYTHNVKIIKGAKEFLYSQKQQGKRLVLASATDKEVLKTALKHFEIDVFDEIFTEGDLNISKSNVEFYKVCLQKLNVERSEVLYFEDSFSAIQTATELGIETVGVLNKYNKKHKKEIKQLCSFVIKNYRNKELIEYGF